MNYIIVENGGSDLLLQINQLLKEHGNGAVLPVSEEELSRRFEDHEALIAMIGDCIVGYIALSKVGDHAVEVRSLVTDREYRQHGIGTALVIAITEVALKHHQGRTIVAMASVFSEGLFRKQCFEDPKEEELELLKDDLLAECTSCKIFQQGLLQGKMCCHTLLVWHKGER